MSEGLNKVKRRIQTVESTRKITSSMKLVSSVKFAKLQKEFNSKNSYMNEIDEIGKQLFNAAKAKGIKNEFSESFEGATKNLYVVICSNLGLCGSYNNNVLRFVESIYKEGDEFVLVGNKLFNEISDKGKNKIYDDFIGLNEHISILNAKLLKDFLKEKYLTKEYKKISIIYSSYKNVLSFVPLEKQLLPISYEFDKKIQNNPADFEPNLEFFFDKFLNKYLTISIYINLFEASLCEQSARRNAMENADKNAEELVDKLKLEYNKARQASITQEITEVVAGSLNK